MNMYKMISLITDEPALFGEKINEAAKEGYYPVNNMTVIPTMSEPGALGRPKSALLFMQLVKFEKDSIYLDK